MLLKVPGGIYMQAPDVSDWPNDPHGTPMLSKMVARRTASQKRHCGNGQTCISMEYLRPNPGSYMGYRPVD